MRAVQAEVGRPLALIADLQGPKIRIGDLAAPVDLEVGDAVVIAGRTCAVRTTFRLRPTSWGRFSSPTTRCSWTTGTFDSASSGWKGAERCAASSPAGWSSRTKE